MGIRTRSLALVLTALVWGACGDESSVVSTMDSGAGGGGLDGSMTLRDGAVADEGIDMPTAVDLGVDAFVPDAAVATDAGADAETDAAMPSCSEGESAGGVEMVDMSFAGVSGSFTIRGTRVLVDGEGAPFVVYVVEEEGDGTTHLFVARRQWNPSWSACEWRPQYVRELLPDSGTGTSTGPVPPLQAAYDAESDTVVVMRTYSRFEGTLKEGFLIDGFRLDAPSLIEASDIQIPLEGSFGGPPTLAHDANGFFVVYSVVDVNDELDPLDDTVEQRISALSVFLERLPPLDFQLDEESLPIGFSCVSGRPSFPISVTVSLPDGTRAVAWRGACFGGEYSDRIVVASNASGGWLSSVVRISDGSVYEPTLTLVADDVADNVWVVSTMAREMVASEDVPYPPTEVDRVPLGELELAEPVAFPMPLERRDRILEAGGAFSGGTLRLFGRRAKSYFSLPDEMDELADGPVYATTTAPGYAWSTSDIIPPSLMGGEVLYTPKTAGRGAHTVLGEGGRMWGGFFVDQYFSTGGGGFWDRSVWVWREPTLATM